MSERGQWCPSCGAQLKSDSVPIVKAYSFSCKFCHAPLRIQPMHHLGILYGASVVIAAVLALLLNFHGIPFFVVILFGSLPVYFTISMLLTVGHPPKIVLRPPTDFIVRFPSGPREE